MLLLNLSIRRWGIFRVHQKICILKIPVTKNIYCALLKFTFLQRKSEVCFDCVLALFFGRRRQVQIDERGGMLDVAVTFLADQFNAYLLRRTGSASLGQIVPGGILDEKGNLAIASGTVRLCLVNIEEERVLREQVPARIMRNGREMVLQPELKLKNYRRIVAAIDRIPDH